MGDGEHGTRWILGFDGGCAKCAYLAQELVKLSSGKLTAKNLRSPEVERWREQALGPSAPWAPTLFAVEADTVRAWVGAGLVAQLGRLVGPHKLWRIATIVGGLMNPAKGPASPGRRKVLRQGLVGSVGAMALLSGNFPATRLAVAQEASSDLAAAAGSKPGRYARKAGVQSWRVTRRPGGAIVEFRHKRRSLSGTLTVTFGGGNSTSWILTSGRDRVRMAMSSRTISGVDANGRSMTARWDHDRRQWDITAESKRLFTQNGRQFNIGFGIAADLEPRRRSGTSSRTTVQEGGITPASVGTCFEITDMPPQPSGRCFTNEVGATSGPELSLTAENACEEVCSEHIVNECNAANYGGCQGCCEYDAPKEFCFTPDAIFSLGLGCTCFILAKPYLSC
jgi:hypothetical protein